MLPLILSLAEDFGGTASGFNKDPGLKPVNSPFMASLDARRSDCDVAGGFVGDEGASARAESLLSPLLDDSLKLLDDARGEGKGLPSLLPGAFPNGL